MIVINLFGGPGAGKSTVAAALFAHLKGWGQRVELVTEFAKDLVWDRCDRLHYPPLVAAEQGWRLERLRRAGASCAITDSPLPLVLAYQQAYDAPTFSALCRWVQDEWARHTNINIRVKRVKAYERFGRHETESAARALDDHIDAAFRKCCPGGYDMEVSGTPDLGQAAKIIHARLLPPPATTS